MTYAITLVAIVAAYRSGEVQSEPLRRANPTLEAMNAFPPTTFSITLLVRPPPGRYVNNFNYPYLPEPSDFGKNFVRTLCDPSWAFQCYLPVAYNYTPPYPADPDISFPPSVIWNVAAALGVQLNAGQWNNIACMLGDISKNYSVTTVSNCSSDFGISGPGLLFGTAGAPLLQTVMVTSGSDTVKIGASLDNIGTTSIPNAGNSFEAQFGDAVAVIGNSLQAVGAVLAETPVGGLLSFVGSIAGAIGAGISFDADANPSKSRSARQLCLGGFLGNPTGSSQMPLDTVMASVTGRQLYEGTQNGPLFLKIPTQMQYISSDPPFGWGACEAATDVIFVIDRPRNPGWSNGLAFQPRSADSAVVRRPNSVESFRVDTTHALIEHDSWTYAPYEVNLDPTDGLAQCPTSRACSPTNWSEPVGPYVASFADPSAQLPPVTTHPTPITALSSDHNHLAVFFVDDNGRLYVGSGISAASDITTWKTWLLAKDLPANAPVAAVRGYPYAQWYILFWVGNDGGIHTFALDTNASPSALPFTAGQPASTASIAAPGASVAAIQRTPGLYEVFVIGASGNQNVLWQWSNQGGAWNAPSPITSSLGQVASDSPLTVVATTTSNLDLFYLDPSHALQHRDWSVQLNAWSLDLQLPHVTATPGTRQLSAVSRTPNNIDVVFPCDATGLCNVSLTPNTVPGIGQNASPAISSLGWVPAGPLSIVAASSAALDVIATTPSNAYDISWQSGASAWSTSAPAPYCDSSSCRSFRMSVTPTYVPSAAANDTFSVHLSTVANDSTDIQLTLHTPTAEGITPGVFAPTSVAAGQSVDVGFSVALGTPPGRKNPIIIVGSNGLETHSVTVDVTTTSCVSAVCGPGQCGSINDNCGHIIDCPSCGTGLVCSLGLCVSPHCGHPRPCPRGSHWDEVECACVGD